MRIRKFMPPMSILLFLALTLAGTYYVRLRLLEKAMSIAMEMKDGATVAELAHSFPSPVNARGKDRRTPLWRAAEWGDRALVELLLRKGADIHARDDDGWTPLHEAAYKGQKEIVELLIARGADINAIDNYGRTPLHWAAFNGFTEIVEFLLAKGADVNVKDKKGQTALQLARPKYPIVAGMLRKAGAKE